MIGCGAGEFCNRPAAEGHYVCADHLEQLLPSIERLGYIQPGQPTRCLAGDCTHAAGQLGYCQEHRKERRQVERAREAEKAREKEADALAARILERLTDEAIAQAKLAGALDMSTNATAFRYAIKRLVESGRVDQTSTGLRLPPPPLLGRAERIGRIVAQADAPVPREALAQELDVSTRSIGRAVVEAASRGWVRPLKGGPGSGGVAAGPTPLAA